MINIILKIVAITTKVKVVIIMLIIRLFINSNDNNIMKLNENDIKYISSKAIRLLMEWRSYTHMECRGDVDIDELVDGSEYDVEGLYEAIINDKDKGLIELGNNVDINDKDDVIYHYIWDIYMPLLEELVGKTVYKGHDYYQVSIVLTGEDDVDEYVDEFSNTVKKLDSKGESFKIFGKFMVNQFYDEAHRIEDNNWEEVDDSGDLADYYYDRYKNDGF